MKKHLPAFAILILLAFLPCLHSEDRPGQTYEYATVRYRGGHRVDFYLPNGKIEILCAEKGPEKLAFHSCPKVPDTCDERMFYLSQALNFMAKEGFEPVSVASLSNDDLILRRPTK